jgi:diguanylate cyclase (GGDEF)-like protein/PAS domain S-box-containing protein
MPSKSTSKVSLHLNSKTLFVLISLVIAALDATLITINYFLSESALKKDFSIESAALYSAFQASMTDAQHSLVLISSVFSEDSQIQQLFLQGKQAVEKEGGGAGGEQASKIRKQLYELVAPRWNKAIKTLGARQLHFHLGPGSLSFLRVHRPEKYGDRMDNVRFTVVDTNAEQSPRSGFETGRVYSGIRGMVPVFAANKNGQKIHVGTLESGTSFNQLVNVFKQVSGSDVTILLKKEHIDETMWPDFISKRFKTLSPCGCVIEATSRPMLIDILDQAQHDSDNRISRNRIAQLFKIDQDYYSASFFPLRDYLGNKIPERKDVGSIMIWKNVSERVALFHQDQTLLIIWGIISFLFIEFLLFWGFKRGTAELKAKIKQRNSLLQVSEERFELAMKGANDGLWDWNLKTNEVYFSPRWKSMLGYQENELKNHFHTWEKLTNKKDLEFTMEMVNSYISGKRNSFTIEFQMQHKDGHWIDILSRALLVRNEDNEPFRLVGTHEDITERKQIEQALAINEKRYRLLIENLNLLVWEYSLESNCFTYVSPQAEKMLGYPISNWLEEKTGRSFWESIIHPDDRDRVSNYCIISTQQGKNHSFDYRAITAKGNIIWLHDIVTVNLNENGKPESMIGCMLDINDRADAETKLKLSASVFTNAWEGILITDADTNIIDINDAFLHITGYSREEILGKKPSMLRSGHHDTEFYETMWSELREKLHWSGEIWNKRKNGEVYAELLNISAVRDENSKIKNYVALFSDITERKNQQQQLEDMANYDILTNLPNRLLLADRLRQAITYAERHSKGLAVVFLDLDGFKEINDTYGHDVGDQLLIAISMRMKNVLRDEDTLARIGGDEFVAVLLDLQKINNSLPLIRRLLIAASKTVEVGEQSVRVSASIGVTFYPQQITIDADQLVRQADQAMYLAKQAGKNQYKIFDAEQDSNIRDLHKNLDRLQLAFKNNEFVLYYQPKVNMSSGETIGVEALIRWQHPDKGLLLPGEFLPLIEEHPLSIDIGQWVIKTALTQIAIWQNNGINLSVSVNVSGYQLQQHNFVEDLQALLSTYTNKNNNFLQLEVLETSALQDMSKVSRVIQACKKIGIRFALDDFGTGYSSLTYLKQLPVSWIKIDRSFVRDMLYDPDDLAILEGIIGMASAFRHHIIAEGVENIEQGELLLQLGCELAQGFEIARPMPEKNIVPWMASWQPNPLWTTQRPVRRDDLPILFASVEHRAWISQIEKHLENKQDFLPPLKLNECRFGQWLHAEGAQTYASQPLFTSIEKTHQQVHAMANSLLSLQSQGKHSQAKIELNELYKLRDKLLSQLKKLVQISSDKLSATSRRYS